MAGPGLTAGRFEAAIFDLFGTLVPEFPRVEFFGVVRAAAEILGADPEAFEREWTRTAVARPATSATRRRRAFTAPTRRRP